MNGEGPVIGLDIDGSLADYHGHFLRFAAGWLGREMPPPTKINPGVPLHKFMGVSKTTYRKIKLAYRQGGLKRSLPAYSGADDLSRTLRSWGAEVVICTSRPYLQLGPVDPDTRHWLLRNRVQHDNLIWGERKYIDLVRLYGGERIVGVLDDLPRMIEQAEGLGLSALMMNQPYNVGLHRPFDHIHRVQTLQQAETIFYGLLEKWHAERGKKFP